jgi:hypothetical protein
MIDSLATRRKKTRFIAEARFESIPEVLDVRGHITATIFPKVREQFPHWTIQPNLILFSDTKPDPVNEFAIGPDRISVILEDPGSVSEFGDVVRSKLRLAYEAIGKDLKVVGRFGVRFVSIFDAPEFLTPAQLVTHVVATTLRSPGDIPLKPTDSLIRLIHEQGAITVGPALKDEEWVRKIFKRLDDRIPKQGIAVDVDSFAKESDIGSAQDLVLLFDSVLALTVATEAAFAPQLGLVK